jgi:hypothetical protein
MELRSAIRNGWTLLITIVVVILLLDKGCSPISPFSGETIIKRDTTTVYIEGKDSIIYDTIKDIRYITKDFHYYTTDTIFKSDTSNWSIGHMYTKKDSLLNATIGVWSKEKPDSITLDYSMAFPTIFRVDTLINNITEKVRVNQLYLGPELIVYPGFKGGFISADFISHKGWQAEAGVGYGDFGTGFNTMGKVGIKKVISLRKKR